MRAASAIVGALIVAVTGFPAAAAACDEPSGDCGPWYGTLSDETVAVVSVVAVAALVGIAFAVVVFARWRRVHRVATVVLGLEAVGLCGAAAFAAISL